MMGQEKARISMVSNKKPIRIKPENRGKLREQLGTKPGKKISNRALNKAKKNASPAEQKRITFAQNAKKWNHKGASRGK